MHILYWTLISQLSFIKHCCFPPFEESGHSLNCIYIILFSFSLGSRENQRYFPSASSLYKCLWRLGLCQTLELSLGLPWGWQGPRYLGYRLLFPRVHITRKLQLKWNSQNSSQALQYERRHTKLHLNRGLKCWLPQDTSRLFTLTIWGNWEREIKATCLRHHPLNPEGK